MYPHQNIIQYKVQRRVQFTKRSAIIVPTEESNIIIVVRLLQLYYGCHYVSLLKHGQYFYYSSDFHCNTRHEYESVCMYVTFVTVIVNIT